MANQAAAQDLANANNANNIAMTPAEQAAVKANVARLLCICLSQWPVHDWPPATRCTGWHEWLKRRWCGKQGG